jgi:uncharacterized protein
MEIVRVRTEAEASRLRLVANEKDLNELRERSGRQLTEERRKHEEVMREALAAQEKQKKESAAVLLKVEEDWKAEVGALQSLLQEKGRALVEALDELETSSRQRTALNLDLNYSREAHAVAERRLREELARREASLNEARSLLESADRMRSHLETEKLEQDRHIQELMQVLSAQAQELQGLLRENEVLKGEESRLQRDLSCLHQAHQAMRQQLEKDAQAWEKERQSIKMERKKFVKEEEQRLQQVSQVNQNNQRLRDEAGEAGQRITEILDLLTVKAAEGEDLTNFEVKLLIHMIKNRKKLTLVLNNASANTSNASGNGQSTSMFIKR